MLANRPPAVIYHSKKIADPEPGQYIQLTSRDAQAFDTFAPITVGYYFATFIDPASLCQSLAMMFGKYPGYSGRVVTLGDSPKYYIKPWIHQPSVTAIEVPTEVLWNSAHWNEIMNWFPLRPGNVAGGQLFQGLLLHSNDHADGCTLIVSIDHGLADATSCSLFVHEWSQQHLAMFGAVQRLSEMAMPSEFERTEGDLTIRRFYFNPHIFTSLKGLINASGPPDCQVTVNDILLAICMCAAVPQAKKTGSHARIAMMVDPRGRGAPKNFMGNAAMPMNVFVEWAVLASHDLAVITRAIRCSVKSALAGLKDDCVLDPENLDRTVTEEAIMQWNSWARMRDFMDATFGHELKKFEWANLHTLKESHVFIVVPVTATGGLALQVALPHLMMSYLVQIWDTYTKPQPAT